MANNAWQSVYRQIGSTSDLYADNQRVVSLWPKGTRYSGLFLITDGGDNGRPSIWSFGGNDTGQNATGRSNTDNTNTSSLGNFGLYECRVARPSNFHENTTSELDYSSDALRNIIDVGNPVAVFSNGYLGHTACTCILITDNGTVLWCGDHDSTYLTSNQGPSFEYHQMPNNQDFARAWQVVRHLPKCKEAMFSFYGDGGANGFAFLSNNGDVYIHGGHSRGASGTQFGPTSITLN